MGLYKIVELWHYVTMSDPLEDVCVHCLVSPYWSITLVPHVVVFSAMLERMQSLWHSWTVGVPIPLSWGDCYMLLMTGPVTAIMSCDVPQS